MIITIVIILIFIIREEKHKIKFVIGLTITLNDLFGIFLPYLKQKVNILT
jgi:hypothetical protein